MGAVALPLQTHQRFQWPRVAAWSGTLSLHVALVALLLLPPTAATLLRPAPEKTMVVSSYVIPPPPPPIPPDPHPQPIKHAVKTPIPTPTRIRDTRPPVISDAPSEMGLPAPPNIDTTSASGPPVDVAPSPLAYGSRTRVPYPVEAARRREHGTVVLRVLVGTDGHPQTIEIESSSGSPRLDAAAKTAVAQWTFRAGTRDGLAYAAWARVPITFDLQTL